MVYIFGLYFHGTTTSLADCDISFYSCTCHMSLLKQRLRRNSSVSTFGRRCLHGCRRHHFNRYLGLFDANARADAACHAERSDPPDG